jgi:hypothetical protein
MGKTKEPASPSFAKENCAGPRERRGSLVFASMARYSLGPDNMTALMSDDAPQFIVLEMVNAALSSADDRVAGTVAGCQPVDL